MVKQDGSVYYLDSNATKQSGKITIEQSSSRNIDYIMTKNSAGGNSILTIDKNGKGAELDIKSVSYTPKKDDKKDDKSDNKANHDKESNEKTNN